MLKKLAQNRAEFYSAQFNTYNITLMWPANCHILGQELILYRYSSCSCAWWDDLFKKA